MSSAGRIIWPCISYVVSTAVSCENPGRWSLLTWRSCIIVAILDEIVWFLNCCFFCIVSRLQTHLYFKEDSSWSLTENVRKEGKHMWSGRAAGNFGPACRLPQNSTFFRKKLEQNKWLSNIRTTDNFLANQRMSQQTNILGFFGILFLRWEIFIPGMFSNKKKNLTLLCYQSGLAIFVFWKENRSNNKNNTTNKIM